MRWREIKRCCGTPKLDLGRYRTLVKQDSLSHQQLDTQASLVQQYTGTIATDQAQIDSAKLKPDLLPDHRADYWPGRIAAGGRG